MEFGVLHVARTWPVSCTVFLIDCGYADRAKTPKRTGAPAAVAVWSAEAPPRVAGAGCWFGLIAKHLSSHIRSRMSRGVFGAHSGGSFCAPTRGATWCKPAKRFSFLVFS